MTFWDVVLEKCAGKGKCNPMSPARFQPRSRTRIGAYYQMQTRLIEADMSDIETPSNPQRPSVRFLSDGEISLASSTSAERSNTSSAEEAPKPLCSERPHARVKMVLQERRERLHGALGPLAEPCPASYSNLTAAGMLSSPFHPSHRKHSLQSFSSSCSRTSFQSTVPFFVLAGQANSKYAHCAAGPIGEVARAKKREQQEAGKEESLSMDPFFVVELKAWLKKQHPSLVFPDTLSEDLIAQKERESEEAFLRKRAEELARPPPMRKYVDDNGISIQVGFDSLHKDPTQPLFKRRIEDMRNFSSCVRRVSIEGLDSLEPIDEMQVYPVPPSTVPSQMKRQQARRQLKHRGYPQNQRIANAKRSQSSHVLVSRKTNQEPQVPAARRPEPNRRITIATTHAEAENAIESDDEDEKEECKQALGGKTANQVEEVEDDGNDEFTDIEEEDEEDTRPAYPTQMFADRLMAGDFTPEGHARHEMEKTWDDVRRKSRGSQRTLVEHHPKVVSNKETVAVAIHYKPTKIINNEGLVMTYKA